MIFGIGTDIVDINRINEIDSLDNFAKKILSKNEKKFFENLKEIHRVKHLAKQFAGKEAIAKAFGPKGFSNSLFTSKLFGKMFNSMNFFQVLKKFLFIF